MNPRRAAFPIVVAMAAACSGTLEDTVGADAGADGADTATPDARMADTPVPDDTRDATATGDAPVDVFDGASAPDTTTPDVTTPDAMADAATPDVMADVSVDLPRDVAPDMAPTGALLYRDDRTHSPITADLVASLRAVAARGTGLRDDVLAKLGDSHTVSTNYLQCFAGANVDLAGRTSLRATLDVFGRGDAGGSNPYVRTSLAATVGWSAWAALAGSPSPLARELDATRARVATVMFGTNDIQSRDIFRYGQNLLDIADQTLARGAVPVFSTIPARGDDATADAWVPRYNAVARAVAQTRGVPLVDLHRVLDPIPRRGLGPDNLHLNAYTPGGASRACVFTAAGLQYGNNVRNLAELEALDRLVVALRGTPTDADAPRLAGRGTPTEPFVIPWLPFGDARDTSRGGSRVIARYPCRPTADESGAEFYYRFDVTRATRVRAMVITRGTVDVDLHLLTGGVTADRCVARDDRVLVVDLAPGTHYLVADTWVSGTTPLAGEYLLVVVAE